jgi:hypothetical protein
MRLESNRKFTVFWDVTPRTLCCRWRQIFFQNVGNFFGATYPKRGLLLRSATGETKILQKKGAAKNIHKMLFCSISGTVLFRKQSCFKN